MTTTTIYKFLSYKLCNDHDVVKGDGIGARVDGVHA